MKTRFVIILLVAIVVILAVVFWLRSEKQIAAPELTQRTVQSTQDASSPAIKASISSRSAPITSLAATSSVIPEPLVTNNQKLLDYFSSAVQSANLPIEFYGRVIDQDSNAISGAKVKIGILHLTLPNPLVPEFGSKNIQLEQTSDANGRFEFHGETGEGFGVGITKDGYDAEPGPHGFGGGTSGSYENPVVFKMWSTNIHERLITGDKSFKIVPDGRPYFLSLTDGTISESGTGDLKIWIQYTNQVVQGQLYDWSAGIEVVDGGLLEVPQAHMNSGFLGEPPFAMYSAPTAGYIPSFSLKSQIKGGQSGEIGNRYFYLLLQDGKEYGRMSINLFAPYGYLYPGLIRLSYAINPSGSRILR